MNIFGDLLPKDLYHSYVIHVGHGHENAHQELIQFLEDRGDIAPQSPDVLVQEYDSFTIADSKFIKDWASNKGITNNKKVAVIATKFINREAEQSLLKILEEPAESTHLFIVIPMSVVLLDTIVSRCHVVNIVASVEDPNENTFVSLSPKARIEYIADMIKVHEDDENSGGLRHDAISIINSVERVMYEKLKIERQGRSIEALPLNYEFIFTELRKAREYLGVPGASVKMILEHIALVI